MKKTYIKIFRIKEKIDMLFFNKETNLNSVSVFFNDGCNQEYFNIN